MAKTWPATLPAPLANSVKLRTQKNTRSLDFSARNRRTVTRASNPPSVVECVIKMDSVQLDAFDYFLKFDLNYGAEWIDAPWLTALGFGSHYARFLELPKINKTGGIYTLQCVFEVVAQSVAIQMPNTAWPVSNKVPGPTIPLLGLVASYDASADTMGNTYTDGMKLPDAYGSGFYSHYHYYWSTAPQSAQVVMYNSLPAIRVHSSGIPSGYIGNIQYTPGSAGYVTIMAVSQSPTEIYADDSSSITTFYSSSRHIVTVQKPITNSALTTKIWINDTLTSSYTGQAIGDGFRDIFNIGKYRGSGYSYIHEAFIWLGGQQPSDTELHDLQTSLMTKWLIV